MIKRKRVLLVSCSIILLCLCIIVGMTYALFSDVVSVKNHLRAGALDVSLKRTCLEYSVLDEDGYLAVTTLDGEVDSAYIVDFTNTTAENVFGIDATDIKIVPGSYFDADLEIGNNGNVAFTFEVGIRLLGDSNALAEQLQVTVTHADGSTTTKPLSELAGGLTIAAGEMSANDSVRAFGVRVDFVNCSNNNAAQSETAVFDLIVTAVQKTA